MLCRICLLPLTGLHESRCMECFSYVHAQCATICLPCEGVFCDSCIEDHPCPPLQLLWDANPARTIVKIILVSVIKKL
jgi:hypothetical protein